MAERGKRTIFVDEGRINAIEALATTATILPGMSLVQSASGFAPDNQADTVGAPLVIADYDFLKAEDVDTAWGNGQTVTARMLTPNMRANARVATGNNITARGVRLARDGVQIGNLKIAGAGDVAVAVSDEIINVTANDTLVRIRGI